MPPHDGRGAWIASISTQADVSHATINANGATLQANGTPDCDNAATVNRCGCTLSLSYWQPP